MAARSVAYASLFLVLFVVVLSDVAEGHKKLGYKGCSFHCKHIRCSKTHHKGNCVDTCKSCCRICGCVPPGFYGNERECSCYNNLTTKEGKHKCP